MPHESLSLFLLIYALIAAFVGWAMYDGLRGEPLRSWLVCVGFGILWMPLFALALVVNVAGHVVDYVIKKR